MRLVQRIYLALCRKWGPGGLTLSAWAWKRFVDTGDTWWRNRIDGLFLLVAGQSNHCASQYARETRNAD